MAKRRPKQGQVILCNGGVGQTRPGRGRNGARKKPISFWHVGGPRDVPSKRRISTYIGNWSVRPSEFEICAA